MGSVLMENKVLNIDKSSWVLTRLGDLAKDISKRVDNPGESEYDKFVGLRNFVSGDIKIKTWETTENLASSAKAFQAGDILFARRNAYLRRASLVDFDGCCSGDAFVLRENHDKVVPGFLAFLMNSNALWDYANSNAAGTMSKRVKWRDLAEYEFLLPPKDQQAQLAKLLWAMDEVIEKRRKLAVCSETIVNSILLDLVKNEKESSIKPKSYNHIALQDLVTQEKGSIRRGPFGSTLRKEYFVSEGIKVYEQSNIIYNDFNRGSYFIAKEKFDKVKNFEVVPGDILISCSGTVGKVAIVPQHADKGIMNQALLKLRLNEDIIIPSYFKNLFESEYMQLKLLQKTQGSAMKNLVALKEMKKIKFPVVDLGTQEIINQVILNKESIRTNPVSSSKSLQKSLINQIF